MPPVRILGIDPGSRATGFAVLDARGTAVSVVAYGVVRTDGEHNERLRTIFIEMGEIVRRHEPAEIAIESVFVQRNVSSALKLGQARAAALCATFGSARPVFEYAPRHIKKAVAGTGRAEKAQVQQMVKLMLGLHGELQADSADALAVALCHAHSRGANALIGLATRAVG